MIYKKKKQIYILFEQILNSKKGTTIDIEAAIKKLGLDKDLKNYIETIKLVDKERVYVNWNSEKTINFFSKYIKVHDGVVKMKIVSLPKDNGKFYNGILIESENFTLKSNGTLYNTLFLSKSGDIYGIIFQSENNTILTSNAYGL